MLIYYLLDDPDTWVYVAIVTGVTLLFTPLILRYSRALMLYLFGGAQYDKYATRPGQTKRLASPRGKPLCR